MYTPWLQQLETRCASLNVWNQIDPTQTMPLKLKLRMLTTLGITKYEQKLTLGLDEDRAPLLLEVLLELSANGLKA
jgi:hypothetical protein